jgi:hypothetical protein
MKSHFDIWQSGSTIDRPPISSKVKEYLIEFITENVLREKRIILDSNWNVVLAMFFLGEGERFTTTNIFLANGGPRTIKSDRIKMHEAVLPIKRIKLSQNPYLTTIEMMYETLKMFLTKTYKKVKPELMDELWKKVDLEYLLSLPYPAPFSEQKYAADHLA